MTTETPRQMQYTCYSVSFQDLVDIWIGEFHLKDNVLVIWDAITHLETLAKTGFLLDKVKVYDNKIITIVMEDVRDCFYAMDAITAYDPHPFIQVYSKGKVVTDNIN